MLQLACNAFHGALSRWTRNWHNYFCHSLHHICCDGGGPLYLWGPLWAAFPYHWNLVPFSLFFGIFFRCSSYMLVLDIFFCLLPYSIFLPQFYYSTHASSTSLAFPVYCISLNIHPALYHLMFDLCSWDASFIFHTLILDHLSVSLHLICLVIIPLSSRASFHVWRHSAMFT